MGQVQCLGLHFQDLHALIRIEGFGSEHERFMPAFSRICGMVLFGESAPLCSQFAAVIGLLSNRSEEPST